MLGGDYVTWGGGRNRRFVGAGGRGARAAVGAARRLRGARQPRRRPRHAGGAEPRRASTVLGRADADRDQRRAARHRRDPLLDAQGWSTSRASSRARRRTSSCWPTHPSRLPEAAALAVPLVLSGHTHGGQIVLPGIGAIAAREFPVVAGQRAGARRPRSSSAAAWARSTSRPPELPAGSRAADAATEAGHRPLSRCNLTEIRLMSMI